MKTVSRLTPLYLLLLALSTLSAYAGELLLLGKNDQASPFYEPGQEMTFEVRLVQDGQPVTGKRLTWERTGDDGLVQKGEAVSAEEPLVITTSTEEPGFVRILVTALDDNDKPFMHYNEKRKRDEKVQFDGGAGVQPQKLKSIPEPADFDAWWAKQKAHLAQTPMEVIEQIEMPQTHSNVDTWDVKVTCPGNPLAGESSPRPMSGYLSKTHGAAPGSAAAIVHFHGYGVRSSIRRDYEVARDPNKPVIVLDINAHGIENGQSAAFYQDFKDNQLKGYAFDNEENQQAESAYFYGMAMRALRALQFIKSQPEWDGKTLTVIGGSQGGFQALLAAGLDPDITRCNAGKPWVCDLGGTTVDRLRGWRPDYTPALAYYDPANHAKRIHADTTLTIGLGDYTCPPSSVTVVYNNIPDQTPKSITYIQGATHSYTPPDPQKFTVSNEH